MESKSKNKYVELLKNTGLLAIGNFSSKILVFMLIPLYTNVLTTAEYGIYDILITTVQLFIPIFSLNVADGVLRFVLENHENVNEVFRVALKYSLFAIVPAVLIILVNNIVSLSVELTIYGLYVLVYYIAYMFNQFFIQFAKGIDQVAKMTISGVIGTLITIVVCIVGLLVLKLGLSGFFYANIMGQLMPAAYLFISLKMWRYMKKPGANIYDRTLEKRLLAYSIPLIMTTIGWWLNNTSDKYIITLMRGVDVNGLLSVAYKIPSILTILYGIFIQAWQISAMKEYGKNGSVEFYNKVFVMLNIFVYVVASGLIILTRPLAHLAFAKEFYNAWMFVPYLMMSAVFTASAGYIAPILTSEYKTAAVAKSTIIGGIVNVILNIVLLYLVGDIGVALATMISSFIILWIRFKSTEGIITNNSLKKGCMLWVLLTLQATFEVFRYEYLQTPLIIFALIYSRNDLKSMFNKICFYSRRNKI